MENLLLHTESFNWSDSSTDHNDAIADWASARELALDYNNNIFANHDSFYKVHSWGALWDIATKEYSDIKQQLTWLSQTSFDYLRKMIPLLLPNYVSTPDWEVFCKEREKECNGQLALNTFVDIDTLMNAVHNVDSYHDWRNKWYRENQEAIQWSKCTSEWFPNLKYSLYVLENELDKPITGIVTDLSDAISKRFEKQKRSIPKGGEAESYYREIGSKIAEGNFYKFEQELSSNEQKLMDSLRHIFSVLNGSGEKQYLSIDFEKGMFELHNHNGIHQGAYNFDGFSGFEAARDGHDLESLKK